MIAWLLHRLGLRRTPPPRHLELRRERDRQEDALVRLDRALQARQAYRAMAAELRRPDHRTDQA
jgi:hypothetical protein